MSDSRVNDPMSDPMPDLSALLGSRQEMDALTLIGWIRKILAQPHAERDLDAYVELIRQLCKARNAVLVEVAGASTAAPEGSVQLQARARAAQPWAIGIDALGADAVVARARRGGFAHELLKDAAGKDCLLVLVKVHGRDDLFVALELAPFDRARVNELVIRCMLVTDLRDLGERAGSGADPAHDQLLDMLNLVADVVHHADFVAASLALVNGLVARFGLAFAALVRVSNASAQLTALSHVDKFDRGSEFVQRVESAALNVLKHDRLLSWTDADTAPAQVLSGADDTQAQTLVLASAASRLMAVPMHNEAGETTFVMLLSVSASAFSSDALDRIQFGLDIVEPRLHDLYDRSRSALTRVVRWARQALARVLGPDHLGPKVTGLALFLVLLGTLVFTWPYRVDAASELVTDATRVIAAQFDGHIEHVFVTSGDHIAAGAVLATLDTRELLQQRLENLNDLTRFETEVTKSQAAGALADARISEARADEAKARIEQFDYLLGQASCVAPFAGVVVEGERRDLLNAPVKKGERIFKIAKVENLYLMLYVSERDIRDVRVGSVGEVMLLSRPDQQIGFHVASINPVGQVKGQEGNHFQIKALVNQTAQAWWRPGMTGVAKIDAGPRQIFWLLTHRFVDFMRMKFWF